MMRDYLDKGEARAAIFMALVALSRKLSGREPNVFEAARGSDRELLAAHEPAISVVSTAEKVDVRLSMMNESCLFSFASDEVTREAFDRAQISFSAH